MIGEAYAVLSDPTKVCLLLDQLGEDSMYALILGCSCSFLKGQRQSEEILRK